ncbi:MULTISPECIES: nicotinate-nucleotide--dimethylbenzimidazole phosphoribosyltransferase [unclassified Granulicatella]|uniref:nicotinate-nucleotide--dimethylbenzimidazole phosphoribosyltransferase n=1 Tax=unclassified Granulicatella TaxID=2630493 RepID=UPI001073C0C9|nr:MULTISPECIES: nicotinate-nucleotide--dimethylbenzimidazole phosphoribosyltransferase [unclassified Granulicatella]MBF0779547.1 nicotinate-nucleotide--dimethylbenzimidazole phosphoribosyltransferase [Granulicatella sp. 19428wC4_WM01]TFU96511.1 nicotinate-nucleotide--dimethylbenzimidazole phosphoribosyltransferase [Granulicatella sp. WM01]
MEINHVLENIQKIDHVYIQQARKYCDNLAKPLGALGKLEDIYCRLYAMFCGKIIIDKKIVIVYVADNGICQEGISANPQVTTYQVGKNMLEGNAGINIMTKQVGADVSIVDIGCLQDLSSFSNQKVRYGTENALKRPALTKKEALRAIQVGYEHTLQLIEQGYTVFGTGEMGVGNTTTSVAVISQLLSKDAQEIVGFGAGINQETLAHKAQIIKRMIEHNAPYEDALDVARKVGGLDILGMVGTYLACAKHQLPFVIDGVISIAALLVAHALNESVLDYAFASHCSTEPGYQVVSEFLNLSPMLQLDMRLGEGTGCPLLFFLMDMAKQTMETMPSFKTAHLNKDDYVDIRNKKLEE